MIAFIQYYYIFVFYNLTIIIMVWTIMIIIIGALWVFSVKFPPLLIPLLLFLLSSIKIINTRESAVVERLWKFNRTLVPWLSFVIPLIESVVKKISLKTRSIKIAVDAYAKDNVEIKISIDILFFVKEDKDDIYKSYYSLDDPISAIQSIVDNSLRAKINTFEHIEVLSKRNEFWDYLEEVLWEKLRWWGYTIDSVQITNINLPSELVNAMNRVKTTERQKEAAENEWEAKRIFTVKEAEADREKKKLQWLWLAQQREEVAKGLKNSVEEFKEALWSDSNPNEIMNIILMTNYFDTLKDIWESPSSKVIFTDWSPWGLDKIRNMIIQWIEWKVDSKHLFWNKTKDKTNESQKTTRFHH